MRSYLLLQCFVYLVQRLARDLFFFLFESGLACL